MPLTGDLPFLHGPIPAMDDHLAVRLTGQGARKTDRLIPIGENSRCSFSAFPPYDPPIAVGNDMDHPLAVHLCEVLHRLSQSGLSSHGERFPSPDINPKTTPPPATLRTMNRSLDVH